VAIKAEGEYLQDVRLEKAAAAGTASEKSRTDYKYARLRCGKGKLLPNGAKSQYIPLKEIPHYERAIARGKELSRLQKRVKAISLMVAK
jgi:hypothetical protein